MAQRRPRRRRQAPPARRGVGDGSLLRRFFFLLAAVAVFLPAAVSAAVDCSAQDGTACSSFRDGCNDAAVFCFPSALPSFTEPAAAADKKQEPGTVAFKMTGGGAVTCSSVDMFSGMQEGLGSSGTGKKHSSVLCQAPLVPDNWMRATSGVLPELDDARKGADAVDARKGLLDPPSSVDIELSPPVLDWGRNSLYSASLAFLTLSNLNKENALHVYEPFSSDPQFYPYGSGDLVIEPESNVSVPFVFLPRLLGSSSAHLVLQTNFGGFVIQAKGLAVESPYLVEPLVGMNIGAGNCFSKNLSIHNPFHDALRVEEVAVWISVSAGAKQVHHAVCRLGITPATVKLDSFSEEMWYSMGSDGADVPMLDIRPHRQWEVTRWSSKPILEFKLRPALEGKIFGAICMKLRSDFTKKVDTVVFPIELDMNGKAAYHDSTGLLSVHPMTHAACGIGSPIYALSARNRFSLPIKIASVNEENARGPMVFHIRYVKGLLLFPGSLTEIALVNHTSEAYIKDIDTNCNIVIETNATSSSPIKIPCQDFFPSLPPISEFDKERDILANAEDSDIAKLPEQPRSAAADELVLRNWRSHASNPTASVLVEQELLLPVVEVGSQFPKLISVHNPSSEPALVQLILNSAETIDRCIPVDSSSHTLANRSPENEFADTRFGFSLSNTAVTELYLHPSERADLGPIIFRPGSRCRWSALALIRSNVSGVEALPIRAFGGMHSLTLLEGSEPVRKLEFKLGSPLLHNVSSLADTQAECPSCNQRLTKEVHLKNTGELPLEVKRLKISGSDCALGGFTVNNCSAFSLAPGEKLTLSVSYRADFSSATVLQDLELAMATGGIFVIPMAASIPSCTIDECRKSYFRSVNWKGAVIVVGAICLLLLVVLHIAPSPFGATGEGYYVKIEDGRGKLSKNSKASLLPQSSQRECRSASDQQKSESTFIGNFAVHQNEAADVSVIAEKAGGGTDREKMAAASSQLQEKPDQPAEENTPKKGADLSIRVGKEKSKRRKKKSSSPALAAKSGSHSGNSTPSSPLSPAGASTLKQQWSPSQENVDIAFSRASNEQKQAESSAAPSAEAGPSSGIAADKPPSTSASTTDRHAPPDLPPPAVSLPQHARAPGSNLARDKPGKERIAGDAKEEFTYDIWGGDYFPGHRLLAAQAKEVASKVQARGASEGDDSRSFFAREPKSLVTTPSARAGHGGLPLPTDVTSPT